MATLPPGRTKVVNDVTELVPLLRIVDTDIKRKIFQELVTNWRSLKEIESLYGEEGKEALLLFEKTKLVESKWQSTSEGKPEKVYRTYYTSFHINAHCPITEICDLLTVATASEEEFSKLETKILEAVNDKSVFIGDVAQALNVSQTMVKGLVRRSTKLDYRGHRIEKVAVEE
ncbi:MAG: ArsR family transcriptional regulator [Candidatus Thermoplasmatota archaeon]|nr:ArsR family transcriptional regulator [Candidatus Thermoplasmatota archaeon]MDI6856072.1 ArsR family transcriptional regulator [Candidatus Thermoplasmatota archaeon]MDI6887680.1 ArsR family transcriptional regulator [Candidatus Thermoplasmatota archaeon]